MKKLVSILGGRSVNTSPEALALAYGVGRVIALRGMGVICGGLDGIMEAACRGCQEAGGATIGVFKWNHSQDANRYVDFAIPTSMDLATNNIIVWAGAGVIAFEGNYGTATEIALALDTERPLVVVGPRCVLREEALAAARSCRRIPTHDVSPEHVVDVLLDLVERDDPLRYARNLPR